MPQQKASDFFGEDFVGEAQASPTPQPKEEKSIAKSAFEFFGVTFATEEKPKPKKAHVPITEGSWDEINKKYAAGHEEREKARLIQLEGELAEEHHQPTREILKREIKRVKKNG